MSSLPMGPSGPFASAAEYTVTLDPEFPGDGAWSEAVHHFDEDGAVAPAEGSPGWTPVIVRVEPRDRDPWIGYFAPGGNHGPSGAYFTPGAHQLAVVCEGQLYVVDVRDPAAGAVVACDTAREFVPAPRWGLLLVSQFSDIVAIGSEGVVWRSPVLALDDVRIESVLGDVLEYSGHWLRNAPPLNALDPADGSIVRGEPFAR